MKKILSRHKRGDDERAILKRQETPCRAAKSQKTRNQKFYKVFKDVPKTETVINSYHCAFVGDILLQGFLYVTPNWFCFYSKVLGKKLIEVPMNIVMKITKEKTALIIPNAIGILTNTDKLYVFGSLLSRESTYRCMINVWKQYHLQPHQLPLPETGDGDDITEDGILFTAAVTSNTHPNSASSEDGFENDDDASSDSYCSTAESSVDMRGGHDRHCSSSRNSIFESPQKGPCFSLPVAPPVFDGDQPLTKPSSAAQLLSAPGSAVSLSVLCPPRSVRRRSWTQQATSSQLRSSGADGGEQPKNLSADGEHAVPVGPQHEEPPSDASKPFEPPTNWLQRIRRFSRTRFFLGTSCLLVLLLVVSTVVLYYKIATLQEKLAARLVWTCDSSTFTSASRDKMFSDIYHLKNIHHEANVERFHSALETNIHILTEVNKSLKNLRQLTSELCST